MAKNPRWIKFNFNPWNARRPDCAIRGISAATGLDYREVCKILGVSYKNGSGIIRDTGIDLNDIEEKFSKYFDIVEDYYDNYDFVPDEYRDTLYDKQLKMTDDQLGIDAVSGTTLNEFIDQNKNQGIFIVSLIGNPNASPGFPYRSRNAGHIVCVKCIPGQKHGFIDNFDCGEMLVDAYMRVKKTEPTNSPKHWRYNFDKHQFIV